MPRCVTCSSRNVEDDISAAGLHDMRVATPAATSCRHSDADYTTAGLGAHIVYHVIGHARSRAGTFSGVAASTRRRYLYQHDMTQT